MEPSMKRLDQQISTTEVYPSLSIVGMQSVLANIMLEVGYTISRLQVHQKDNQVSNSIHFISILQIHNKTNLMTINI